jgi:GNAT superfamily N-acetyltransferase
MDHVIARYGRAGRELVVRIANSLPRRVDILEMRTRYYESTLADLGVSVWDHYDEQAVHLLCTENGEAVGSLRICLNTVDRGELHDDFGQLTGLLPTWCDQFVMFSRELVLPSRRATGVATALVHAGCRWWLHQSKVRHLVATCQAKAAGALERLGLEHVTGVLQLGPRQVSTVVMAAEVVHVLKRAQSRLSRHEWWFDEQFSPVSGAAAARAALPVRAGDADGALPDLRGAAPGTAGLPGANAQR